MRRMMKCFVVFFTVAVLWMTVLVFESVREVKKSEITNQKSVSDYFKPMAELVTDRKSTRLNSSHWS